MTNTAEEEIEFSDYFVMLRKNWLLAALIFIIILGASIAYTLTTPKIYQSRSLVMISTLDQTSYLLGGSFASAPKIDVQTQREIVLSMSVLSPVYSQSYDAPFKISVDAIKDSNVLDIRAESTSPATAMKAANKVAESFVNYTKETKKQAASEVNALIAAQVALYQTELDDLNMELAKYKKMNLTNLTAEQSFTYQKLQQSIAAKDKLYNYLLSRSEEIGIMSKETGGNINIIEHAFMPATPIKPNVPLNIAIGVILAIIASLGIVFIKESMKKTFKSIKEIENELGHILGVIPQIRRGEYSSAKDDESSGNIVDFMKSPVSSIRKSFSDNKATDAPREHRSYYLLDNMSEGPFAESIRMLKTNIMFQVNEKDIKLISLVSPQKKDGKTLIALNLALELAHSGKKVLLVDANIRNPLLGKALGIEDEDGLSDVVLGDTKLEKAIKKTSYKNLFLLPAGKLTSHMPSQILSHEHVKELCAKLKASNAEIVIFDNTSLKYSESIVVAAHTQGALFIVAYGKTTKEIAIKSKEALAKVKVHIAGVIINFFK